MAKERLGLVCQWGASGVFQGHEHMDCYVSNVISLTYWYRTVQNGERQDCTELGGNQSPAKIWWDPPPQERHWGACRGRKEKELRSRRKSRLCSSERILKFDGSAFWFICSLSCLASTALYVMEFPPGPLFVCTWTLQNKEEDFIANSVSTLVLET